MAKESGIGASLTIDDSGSSGRDISNDITNVSWTNPRSVQDSTGIDSAGRETILLLADFSSTVNGVFNDATNMSHDVFKTVPSTTVARTWVWALSGQSLTNEVNFTDYQLTRPQGGELTWTAPCVLQDGTAPTWA